MSRVRDAPAAAPNGCPRSRIARVRHVLERDDGSAIAEFVMVLALLLVVAMAIFQLGLALYVRNALVSAAAEGARAGARADSVPADGIARARALITSSLGENYARQVSALRTAGPSGVQVLEVTVTAPLPVVGPIGPSDGLTVTGRAFSEQQVTGASS